MSAKALLLHNPTHSEEITDAIAGKVIPGRCSGYREIREAIHEAAASGTEVQYEHRVFTAQKLG